MVACVEVANLSVETLSGFKVLENVSLAIGCGDFVVISGPSGGGKSTLLKALLGIRDVLENLRVAGDIKVLGVDVLKQGFEKLFRRVGVVLQNPVNQVFSLTVEEEVAFSLENAGLDLNEIRRRVDQALKIMDLDDLRNNFVHTLSIGQIQRVVLASMIALEPELLILDEPCAYLDPATKKRFYEYIYSYWRDRRSTVIVVEHDLDYVLGFATKFLIINRKVIAYGSPVEVLSRVNIEDYGIKEPAYIKISKQFHRMAKNVEESINCLKNFICRNK
ncbi:MAG: ABC transporter ATP-binding protein [Ignisphaera sp.]|uniref:ABC transporter ATP-binding protein n=1 Tax=Ignisphaera aggregans TaxID=334771 RepID=A0A7C4NPV9_9CREN